MLGADGTWTTGTASATPRTTWTVSPWWCEVTTTVTVTTGGATSMLVWQTWPVIGPAGHQPAQAPPPPLPPAEARARVLEVEGSDGRRYRIRHGRAHNADELDTARRPCVN
jgi:hypothetical protein